MGFRSKQGSAALSSARRTSRLGIAVLVAIVVMLLGATPALAAPSTADLGSNNELFYKAAVRQANQLTISGDTASLTVTDTGAEAIDPSGGCAATADPQTVTCTGATSIRVNVSNLDDTVTLTTSLVSELAGRDG